MRDQLLLVLRQALPELELPANLADDADLVGDFTLDSLDMLKLSTALEQALDFEAGDIDLNNWNSLADLQRLVDAALSRDAVTKA